MLSQFGLTLAGTISYGYGNILAPHRITQGLTTVFLGKNGYLTTPPSALHLIDDPMGNIAAAVMERTAETGAGRLFVIGENDMFSDTYLMLYPEDRLLAENIASWALTPSPVLTGTVTLPGYVGEKAGIPLTVKLYDGASLVGTYVTGLRADGGYTVEVGHSGTFDVVVKPWRWLGQRQYGVLIAGDTVLDWSMVRNGDVTDDNSVDIMDLNETLLQFARTGSQTADLDGDGQVGLLDLNIVLINFARTGD
ncbi:MAG: hypothetical protein HRF45_00570 [Fimbriimonadia bacterium]|jgi:hypothetical protein